MQVDLPTGSALYGDSGYTDYEQEDLYAECDQIYFKIHRKKNSLRSDPAWEVFLKKNFRKPIENVFSQITNLFPRKIHAVTAEGFLLKLFLFLLAFTINGCLEVWLSRNLNFFSKQRPILDARHADIQR